ncbi:bifunctional 3-(3-hydroxy-phenyl)propionate/3-hydroxycinnamic acid hydroxylase [Sphaerisporangium krabiense]|uniref:3-(3-hydroxy-phenyl)propionate hydroxylase n=1 Tax=Sphaerisporangium krabiense TaxID=763782 RepID=A0A7W8ZCW5_9ACTN|nr:bifunctional 3-(3-hydroxy-phenyl)propionate/3-hydroxycinnamic acid hydroxylase [Sphaerisporangium krabiense]MBB5631545.1 3-(3-hydroxy-phenyl)propionate hydroxylase [Sphaerisporangium krabiense]
MTHPTTATHDVIVAGAGPVGLALTRLLAMRGHRVALVDPNRVVCHHPRATHLDDETMRTLQTLGAADLEPRFLRQEGWQLRGADGSVFLTFEMPARESDQGWFADYQFHQPDFESRLRGLLADEHVELLLGAELTGFSQTGDAVTARVLDRRTGQERVLRAAYLVGADGANSFVRRGTGVEVEDLQGTQRSLIIDVHPFEHPASLPVTSGFIYCEDERPVTYVPIFPPKLRFEFMLKDGDDARALENPARTYDLLSRWLTPGSYRILRTDVYEWHARLVRGWRQGRVLLAGDAAHEMPPMLGQGMCSGLRDAMNLAWKLSAVLSGADAALLDTYESERAPHVRPYIVESARQSNMIEAFADPAARPEPGPAQVLERYRPLLGPGLVAAPDGVAGQLSPQPRTAEGVLLDDLVGYRFLVAGDRATIGAVSQDTREAWERLGAVVLDEPPAALAAWLASHGADAVIVRPDRYTQAAVAGAAALEEATRALSERLLPARAAA